MPKVRTLPGEEVEVKLQPHVLSFAPKHLVGLLPALWGVALFFIMATEGWQTGERGAWYEFWTFLYGNAPAAYVYTILGLGVLGAIVAVVGIRWRVFFTYLAIGIAAVTATAVWFGPEHEIMLPGMLLATAPIAVIATEIDRRSHRFILTNLRILFRGGVFITRERQLRYEGITDLDGSQGPLGRLFGYGTLIPITQSGFGLGADSSEAHVGVGVGGKAGARGAGVGAGIGVAAGGGKEVSVGRARTYHQLTGVAPYKHVKYLLETLIQNATATPYLREQVDLQKQMVAALSAMQGGSQPPAGTFETAEPPFARR